MITLTPPAASAATARCSPRTTRSPNGPGSIAAIEPSGACRYRYISVDQAWFRNAGGSAATTVSMPQIRDGSSHWSRNARASVDFPALDAPFRTTITVVTIENLPSGGLLIVDGANVVGSRPDGWWRDRAGAASRLRDRLAAAVEGGVFGAVEVVLVVEGKARGIDQKAGIRVLPAPNSGDDTIVGVAAEAAGPVTVVTADRGLRERVVAEGATVVGPQTLYRWLE